ncbi:hypothetical protein [Streptomyces sp. NPDC056723]|uniref:hypothetical protein n=1 Tax=Streptomyces sp. NPDC056723 TaxID=3345925 RepID=UPI00368A7140
MFHKGKHRASVDNARLRRLRGEDRRYIGWCHDRFAEIGSQLRSARARAEVAEGRLLVTQQRVAQLERVIEASAEDTQQIPVLKAVA